MIWEPDPRSYCVHARRRVWNASDQRRSFIDCEICLRLYDHLSRLGSQTPIEPFGHSSKMETRREKMRLQHLFHVIILTVMSVPVGETVIIIYI